MVRTAEQPTCARCRWTFTGILTFGGVLTACTLAFFLLSVGGSARADEQPAERVDLPIPKVEDAPRAARPDDKPVVRAYDCPKQALHPLADRIRRHFADNPRVRVAVNDEASQLILLAPAGIQESFARAFHKRYSRGTRRIDFIDPASPPDQSQGDARFVRAELVEQLVVVKRIELNELEADLGEAFRGRLWRIGSQSAETTKYELRSGTTRIATLEIDGRSNGVRLRGPSPVIRQLARFVAVLDRGSSPNDTIRVIPVRRADPAALKQAIEAYRNQVPSGKPAANPAGQLSPSERQSLIAQTADERDAAGAGGSGVVWADNQQPADQTPPASGAGQQASPTPPGGMTESEMRRRLQQLGTDVQIESLDDLDTLILRGTPRDVEELTRIIKEIERLSTQTVPIVVVVRLKHADSTVLSEVITKVNTDLVGNLRGRVTVAPLTRTNALLIVGWGDAVKSVRSLIDQLDQPIGPDAQFRTFRLRYASATSVSTSVQSFYAGRTGTGQKVTAVPDARTNTLIIHGPPHDLEEAAALVAQLDAQGSASVNQARVFRLRNSLAADVAATLQAALDGTRGGATGTAQRAPLLELMTIDPRGEKILKSGVLADVHITADSHRNAIIVQAPAESMGLLEALIRELDEAPSASGQIKVFRIVNGDAASLAQMLRSLVPAQLGTAALGPQLPTGRGEVSLSPLRFAVDLRTNSIIATGSASELTIIEALLLRLDEREALQRKTVVYRLKNSPANAVAASINDFLRSQRQVRQAAPGNISPFQQIESEVIVVPEPISNSLILSATPRYFDEINEVVQKLDAKPPEVMIQVLIGQIELDNADEFGVELGLQDSVLFDRSLLSNLLTTTTSTSTPAGIVTSQVVNTTGASNAPGFLFNQTPVPPLGNSGSMSSLGGARNVGGQAISNFGVGQTDSQLGFSGLVLQAGSENVSVLLRALQQSQRLEVLSRPEVRTLDNQPAYIQVGQRVPRIVSSTLTALGQINSVQLDNIGLILAVTPRISPDGTIVLEIDAEKSSLESIDTGIPISVSNNGAVVRSPIIDLTTAQTTVSAASGETIVLGGLITKNTNQTSRRVPWLADIPLLGSLFRYDSLVVQRTELLVIMTPYVIRSPQDAEAIKEKDTARMHWTCSDVHEIYGTGNLCKPGSNCPACDHEIPVIHPDVNPRGYLPETPPQPSAPGTPPGMILPQPPPNGPRTGEPAPTDGAPPILLMPTRANFDPFDRPAIRPADFQTGKEKPIDTGSSDSTRASFQPVSATDSDSSKNPTQSARERWANFWKPNTDPTAQDPNRLAQFPWETGR